jgi:hypothetical protein
MPRLDYDMSTVLRLATDAITAPTRVDTWGALAEDIPPALHFVADWCGGDGLFVASNGRPHLPVWEDATGYHLVATTRCGERTDWPSWLNGVARRSPVVEIFPLLGTGRRRLVDTLHNAHTAGYDTFTVDVLGDVVVPTITRRRRHQRTRTH